MDRFIDMASLDVEPNISAHMISVLRTLQLRGFLDTTSEEALDRVDAVVFDPHSSARMRYESLLFVMSHTEGFDDIVSWENIHIGTGLNGFAGAAPAEDISNRKGKKEGAASSKQKKDAADASMMASSLARRQRSALQLETLTEFAEHHLREGNYENAVLLAEAAFVIPDYGKVLRCFLK
jgi:hypothetical protein